jgi:type IV secretory pathway protease TraF
MGSGEVFVVGDFPAGSRDSRHWGPLPTAALRHRIDQK